LFTLLILSAFFAAALLFLTSFSQNTIAQCSEGNQSTYNDTAVNGDGNQVFNLYNYLSGPAALNIENKSGNGVVSIGNCYTHAFAQNLSIPQDCLAVTNLTISYLSANVTNASLTYNALGKCAYPTNSYKAMTTVTDITYFIVTVLEYGLLGLIALWLIVTIAHTMGGGQ